MKKARSLAPLPSPRSIRTSGWRHAFLDEIGDMPLDMQVKLLRVLQEKLNAWEVRKRCRPMFVWWPQPTRPRNARSREEVSRGSFYRLDVFPIETPALRNRGADIGLLISHRSSNWCRWACPKRLVSRETPWPGNVRELMIWLSE